MDTLRRWSRIELNKIYNEDCLEGMKRMGDKSVDVVITSPPYNMNLRVSGDKYTSRQIVKEFSTKYANFNDNLPMDEYRDFNKKVLDECLRVSSLVFYNVQILTGNKRALFELIGHYSDKLKEVIVWDKVNAQPAMREGVMNSQFEIILVLEDNRPIARRFDPSYFERGKLSNLWSIKRGKKYIDNHGATFPLELVDNILKNFTKEEETVLDPFMGSGTTAIACINTNRNYIGFELDKTYYEKSLERISNHTTQTELFDFI